MQEGPRDGIGRHTRLKISGQENGVLVRSQPWAPPKMIRNVSGPDSQAPRRATQSGAREKSPGEAGRPSDDSDLAPAADVWWSVRFETSYNLRNGRNTGAIEWA
jgi:hypothetical protein